MLLRLAVLLIVLLASAPGAFADAPVQGLSMNIQDLPGLPMDFRKTFPAEDWGKGLDFAEIKNSFSPNELFDTNAFQLLPDAFWSEVGQDTPGAVSIDDLKTQALAAMNRASAVSQKISERLETVVRANPWKLPFVGIGLVDGQSEDTPLDQRQFAAVVGRVKGEQLDTSGFGDLPVRVVDVAAFFPRSQDEPMMVAAETSASTPRVGVTSPRRHRLDKVLQPPTAEQRVFLEGGVVLTPGASIGNGNNDWDCQHGTTTGFIRDGLDVYLLTNEHVSGAGETTCYNDPLTLNDQFPPNPQPHVLGPVTSALKNNLVDSSLTLMPASKNSQGTDWTCTTTDGVQLTRTTGMPAVLNGINMVLQMKVSKFGRTTGRTDGRVHYYGTIFWEGNMQTAQRQLVISTLSYNVHFSQPGDSGSPIWRTNSDGVVVGQLWGGKEAGWLPDFTYASAIQSVMDWVQGSLSTDATWTCA